MSVLAAEVPAVLVKHGKMFGVWSGKLKIAVILLALALYVYVLVYLKTMYMRSKRLDRIEELALKNEKLIKHIHGLEEQLAMRANRLNEFYEDYTMITW